MSAQTAKIDRTPGTWSATDAILSEAGSVFNETGLTPRQLADQRAELLVACKAAASLAWEVGTETEDGVAILLKDSRADLYRQLTAAIQRATGEQP